MNISKAKHKTLSIKPLILAGVEIETEYNDELIEYIPVSSYHSSHAHRFGKYFKAEIDGSLSSVKFGYGCGETAEFISVPFILEEHKKVLKDFQNSFIERLKNNRDFTDAKAKKTALKDYLCFNRTTGAHVHISVLNTNKHKLQNINFNERVQKFNGEYIDLKTVLTYDFINTFRAKLTHTVKKKLPHVYNNGWFAGLNRSYARQYTDKNNFENLKYRERHAEFNLTSGGRTLEYRAFNLRGVETWTDFFKIYEILFKTLRTCIYAELRKNKPFCDDFAPQLAETTVKDVFDFNKPRRRTRKLTDKITVF